jgi:hypothetical protein
MKSWPQLRVSGWVAGSLFGLVAANFFLVLLVAGADVFLGQPPQLMVPLFALLVASSAMLLGRRRSARVESNVADIAGSAETIIPPAHRQWQSDAPAYVAMTIIRRPPVIASAAGNDNWKGAVR